MILTFCIQLCVGQGSNPSIGSPYNFGKVRSGIPGTFYEKMAGNIWGLSFIKPEYLVEMKYQSIIPADRYRSQSIQADIKLVFPDGERYYYTNKGGMLYMTSAIVSSEVTKSGFMLVDFESGSPHHINERISGTRFTAITKIDKSDLSNNLAKLFPTADAINLKVNYTISKVNNESGTLDINNQKLRVQKYSAQLSAVGSVELVSRGQIKEVEMKLNMWPSYFKNDLTFGTFEKVHFYSDAFIDPVLSYKIKGTSVIEIRSQVASSEAPTFSQEEKAVIAYPNPSSGDVFIDLINYPKDEYKIEIYNLVGFKVKTLQFNENSNKLKLDLSQLRSSIYSYSIFDSSGKRIASKRINLVSS